MTWMLVKFSHGNVELFVIYIGALILALWEKQISVRKRLQEWSGKINWIQSLIQNRMSGKNRDTHLEKKNKGKSGNFVEVDWWEPLIIKLCSNFDRCPVLLVAGDYSPHLNDTVTMNSRMDPETCNFLKVCTTHFTLVIHHRFCQAIALCFVLLVKQLTTACEASRQASVKQAKASVKHVQSIWQTSTKHLTDVCQTFDFLGPKHPSSIYKAFDRQVQSIWQTSETLVYSRH